MEEGDKGNIGWFWRGVRFLFARGARNSEQAPTPSRAITTNKVIVGLMALGTAMLAMVVLTGLLQGISQRSVAAAATFLFSGLAAAFVAFLIGTGVGMLFGLPTARRVEVSNDAAPSGSPRTTASTGYVESTSLEQIADFLVKGFIALSLTTFDRWMERFDTLAGNVTATMLGKPVTCSITEKAGKAIHAVCPTPDRVPGGLLLAGFTLLGFLIGYLWMRRWFIAEMVTARKTEQEIINRELALVSAAAADGRLGTGTSSANNPNGTRVIAQMVAGSALKAAGKVSAKAERSAQEILSFVNNAQDNDDPWKGAFGGLAAVDGCILSATVSPLVSNPSNFQVDLLVTVSEDGRRSDLTGKTVRYYLHPSFGSETRNITIDGDGHAALQIFSYGGFTVGVLIDDGTLLELDLAQIPGAPQKFVER